MLSILESSVMVVSGTTVSFIIYERHEHIIYEQHERVVKIDLFM